MFCFNALPSTLSTILVFARPFLVSAQVFETCRRLMGGFPPGVHEALTHRVGVRWSQVHANTPLGTAGAFALFRTSLAFGLNSLGSGPLDT